MKRPWKQILLAVAVLTLGLWGARRCALAGWERMLMGPYEGTSYAGTVPTQPVSVLAIPDAGQLEVHELPDQSVPVLLLRAGDGTVRWARLLRPERRGEDRSVATAFIRDLRLDSSQRSSDGFRIRLSCFWEWGGKEGGLIYLDPDGSFDSFALGW